MELVAKEAICCWNGAAPILPFPLIAHNTPPQNMFLKNKQGSCKINCHKKGWVQLTSQPNFLTLWPYHFDPWDQFFLPSDQICLTPTPICFTHKFFRPHNHLFAPNYLVSLGFPNILFCSPKQFDQFFDPNEERVQKPHSRKNPAKGRGGYTSFPLTFLR